MILRMVTGGVIVATVIQDQRITIFGNTRAAVAHIGRASALQAEGCGFKSRPVHQFS